MDTATFAHSGASLGPSPVRAGGFAFATDGRLSHLACRVGQLLAMLARSGDQVTHATRTLARKLGCSVRATQVALRELIAAGYVRRAYSFALRSRRALLLLWRGATPAEAPPRQLELPFEAADEAPNPPEQSAVFCAHKAQHSALTPTPPYKDWEETEELHDDDASSAESSSSGIASSPSGSDPEGGDRALAEALREAAEVFGSGHEGRVRAASARWGALVVAQAVRVAAPKVRAEGKSWGYLLGILKVWDVEGVPPEPIAPTPAPGPATPAAPARGFYAQRSEQRRSAMTEAMAILRAQWGDSDGR